MRRPARGCCSGTTGATETAATPTPPPLADLCVQARGEIEALGRPSETPIDVVYAGTVRIGRELLAQTRELTPPEEKKARVAVFAHQYGLYLDGLEYAYHYLENQGNQVAFVQIVNGALANLANAERAATELGAPECAVRPFE